MLMEPGIPGHSAALFVFAVRRRKDMKTFEEYEAEAAWEAHLENALRHARRQAAERRQKAIRRAVLLWASVALVLAALWLTRDT